MLIRPARAEDHAAIWAMLEPLVRAGEVFALDREMSEAEGLAYWCGADKAAFVAEEEGAILGSYYIRPNQAGRGGHVCNGGYMTAAGSSGRGIARAMCLHSIDEARRRGYRAMQYNFVVSTNERAVRLWESLGFEVVGRLPSAFHHPARGFVDALVMFRAL